MSNVDSDTTSPGLNFQGIATSDGGEDSNGDDSDWVASVNSSVCSDSEGESPNEDHQSIRIATNQELASQPADLFPLTHSVNYEPKRLTLPEAKFSGDLSPLNEFVAVLTETQSGEKSWFRLRALSVSTTGAAKMIRAANSLKHPTGSRLSENL